MKPQVLLCLLHLAMPEEASKEGLCASGACDLSQAADECAALQVKNVAESQADPKKRVDDTLLPNITTDFLQDGKDLQGNEGIPFKIWKIKKIKEALEGSRRHPTTTSTSTTTSTTTATTTTTTTTTTTATTTTTSITSTMPHCSSGDFTFAFENLDQTDNGNSPGRVTGCIGGLSPCGVFNEATSVYVVSNTAGYGLGEYVGNTTGQNQWTVSNSCEIDEFSFFNLGEDAPANGSVRLWGIPGSRCAGLSTFSDFVVADCSREVKFTFKYNP